MPITSWSHSRLVQFESCPRRAYLLYDARIPEPDRPLPPGKTEHANDRGTRVHEACERFVRGEGELPVEAAAHFTHEFNALRELFQEGRVSLEGEWAMNQAWEPVSWNGEWEEFEPTPEEVAAAEPLKTLPERPKSGDWGLFKGKYVTWVPSWLRLKLDAMVHVSETEAISIDYKTGRKFGNELKHAEQLQLYQLVCFLRYPKLEVVTTELWYLDQDELTAGTFTRAQGLRFKRSWDARGTRLTTATEFRPNPTVHTCKYCPYGPEHLGGTGHCSVGVKG